MMKLSRLLSTRSVDALGTTLFVGLVLSTASGCGTLGAMANPKVAWAVQDPAPMGVVVRRADSAAATSKEIDRLLTSTPAGDDSEWIGKVPPSSDDTKGSLKALGDMPMYKTSKARVVPAEVWGRTLPHLKSDSGKYPNLLVEVDAALGDSYAQILAKKKDIADRKAQVASEEDAAGAKGVSDADKKTHQQTIDDLKKQISKAEDDVAPMQKDFLKAAEAAAAKASADVKAKLGPALVTLRQAADDADIADGAAAVRYPLALPTIKDALVDEVQQIVCDIIEEKTGHRPVLNKGFKPDVSLDGGTVKLTLAGLTPSDIGSLSLTDVTSETLKRTQAWVVHALALLADISKTQEILGLEENVLDALLQGFKSSGWTPPGAAPLDTSPTAVAAAASFVPPAGTTTTTGGTVAAALDGSAGGKTTGSKSAKKRKGTSPRPKAKPASRSN